MTYFVENNTRFYFLQYKVKSNFKRATACLSSSEITEPMNNATMRFINGVGQQVMFALNVAVRNTVFLKLGNYINAINATIKRQ